MLELYGLKIGVAPTVYEPAEDTFLLISALKKSSLKNKIILEIGTGSGLIALILAKRAKKVIASDINPEALRCAKENAARNKINNIEFRESDLFENIRSKFDIIAFNPPYLPDEPHSRDIALDGGKTGRRTIRRFIKSAPEFLKTGGKIFLLESSLSQYEKTLKYFRNARMSAEIIAKEKLGWEGLVVIAARRKHRDVSIYTPTDKYHYEGAFCRFLMRGFSGSAACFCNSRRAGIRMV